MSNKYKRGLLDLGGGMHSTEWHSRWCRDLLTFLLKLKWYKYRVDLIEISDCKLCNKCNNQLINRSIDKPVYRFIFQAKMTNFRSFSVRICWFSLFWVVGWAEEKIWRQLDGYWTDILYRHSWAYWSSDLSSSSTNMSNQLPSCLFIQRSMKKPNSLYTF